MWHVCLLSSGVLGDPVSACARCGVQCGLCCHISSLSQLQSCPALGQQLADLNSGVSGMAEEGHDCQRPQLLDVSSEGFCAWWQEAFTYLSQEVPIEAQTPGMYNSLLEAALRASDAQMAGRVLQMMEDGGLAPDDRTAAAALRVMVGCPVCPLPACLCHHATGRPCSRHVRTSSSKMHPYQLSTVG